MSDKICSVCNKKLKLLNFKFKLKDGLLCSDCINVCSYDEEGAPMSSDKTAEEARADFEFQKAINEKNATEIETFQPTTEFEDIAYFNDHTKRWYAIDNDHTKRWYAIDVEYPLAPSVYNYSDILAVKLLEDVYYKDGSNGEEKYVKSMTIKVEIVGNPVSNIEIEIPDVYKELDGSASHKNGLILAGKVMSAFESAKGGLSCSANTTDPESELVEGGTLEKTKAVPNNGDPVPAEELLQLKELYDLEVISKEDFEEKKKQLLGL